jgi:hypothetical protein
MEVIRELREDTQRIEPAIMDLELVKEVIAQIKTTQNEYASDDVGHQRYKTGKEKSQASAGSMPLFKLLGI